MYLIVESWLPEDEHRKKCDLNNNSYEIKHMPRDDRQWGGVICLYKVGKIKPLFPIKIMDFIEVMLTVWSKKVCLVIVYCTEPSLKQSNTQWEMIHKLEKSRIRCKIGIHYIGALAYADDVILLCPSRYGL